MLSVILWCIPFLGLTTIKLLPTALIKIILLLRYFIIVIIVNFLDTIVYYTKHSDTLVYRVILESKICLILYHCLSNNYLN